MSYLRMYRDKFVESNDLERNFYEKEGFTCSKVFLNDNIGGKDLREVMYFAHALDIVKNMINEPCGDVCLRTST